MLSIYQRILFFLLLCIPIRSLAVFISYKYQHKMITKALAFIYLIIGINMMIMFQFNLRQDAPEGGGKTWWNNIRPLHSLLYIMFAIFVFINKDYSYMFLLGDVILGLLVFILHHIN